jgi:hypothetical protein
MMQILIDAQTKKILGAAILGIEGDEAIHSILDVMYAGSALHDAQTGNAHSSDRLGADSDVARGSQAVEIATPRLYTRPHLHLRGTGHGGKETSAPHPRAHSRDRA